MSKIVKSAGLTKTEQRLNKFGEKVFLSLWSYPNTYYKKGKELADLLVICDNHILIFSDKEIGFQNNISIEDAWKRWHNNAICGSITQLYKAEKKIKKNALSIYLDAKCEQRIPLEIEPDAMKIHLICIANGSSQACKKYFGAGCSGSLRFNMSLTKDENEKLALVNYKNNPPELFSTTDYIPTKTFVHVFDDITLPLLFNELDTLKDFVDYLDAKEKFIRTSKGVIYTGEEDLLLNYITNINDSGKHSFINTSEADMKETIFSFIEEDWNSLKTNRKYINKKIANKISYSWDKLIQKTALGILSKETISEKPKGSKHEGAIRYMALEDRLSRRVLSERLYSAFNSYPANRLNGDTDFPYASLIYMKNKPEQIYFLLQLIKNPSDDYVFYREKRRKLLEVFGFCLRSKFAKEAPDVKLNKIIGIALDPPKYSKTISEDIMLIDASTWSDEAQIEYEEVRTKLNIWRTPISEFHILKAEEYPDSTNKETFTMS